MARKVKAPVTGIVTYVSKRGTEVHLADSAHRYRGANLRHFKNWDGYKRTCQTAPIFRWAGVRTGDKVTLHWGGFADLDIVAVDVHLDPQDRVVYPELTIQPRLVLQG